jgi:hypothetical protein
MARGAQLGLPISLCETVRRAAAHLKSDSGFRPHAAGIRYTKARPMLAPSTVPVAPHPARRRRVSTADYCYPRPAANARAKFSWQLP